MLCVSLNFQTTKQPPSSHYGMASLGNVRTETLKAFTEDEYRKIVGGLP
jgi:hypothetical protein